MWTRNVSSAFMLTGLLLRMSQVLRLDAETAEDVLRTGPGDLSPTARESRRRLAWCVWSVQVCPPDLRIQLPCDERSFVFQIPCRTGSLRPGERPGSVAAQSNQSEELCLQAQFLRLSDLRKRVDR
jgi:hypothetical protein